MGRNLFKRFKRLRTFSQRLISPAGLDNSRYIPIRKKSAGTYLIPVTEIASFDKRLNNSLCICVMSAIGIKLTKTLNVPA